MIINLTPHEIVFCKDGDAERGYDYDVVKVVPACGLVARLTGKNNRIGEIDGIPIFKTVYGEVAGLPEPQDGVVYVVSTLVKQRCRDRKDVLVPVGLIRDGMGNIIGCTGLGDI